MVSPSNKHIQKYNQKIDVYDPGDVEKLPKIQTHDQHALTAYRDAIDQRREAVEALDTDEILTDGEIRDVKSTESLPSPAEVADEKREDMLNRLDLAAEAVSEVIAEEAALDTGDFDGFDTTDPIENT